jgi:myo-inositol 2-dehydrogenase / D-chiro-inositol 1-dehydrogenase
MGDGFFIPKAGALSQISHMNTSTTPANAAPALSRRCFLKNSSLAAAGAAAVSNFPFVVTSHASPDDPIRIGVIGCGGRGSGAVLDALGAETNVIYPKSGYHTEDIREGTKPANKNVSVVALADVFQDRIESCRNNLAKLGITVPTEQCFSGFDAYKKVLAITDVNYVILATPPHFRPAHLKAAVEAGKHCFIEKPCAVDAPGVRTVMEAGKLAQQKNLGIVSGTQRRHLKSYNEAIKRIQDGALGEIVYGSCYWNGGVIWTIDRKPEMSDMEWQLRNWGYFTWLGGDHIVEQHLHNLDIMRWVIGQAPVRAMALGGRQARPNHPNYGHIYDHFAVEFEYANGLKMFSQCRQMDNTDSRVAEFVAGTKGTSDCRSFIRVTGGQNWRFRDQDVNPYQQEHQDLIASIRAGKPLNEAQQTAEATLMGIMGRESAYSGQIVEWDQMLNSTKRLGPEKYEFGPLPFPPVAIPGQYKVS